MRNTDRGTTPGSTRATLPDFAFRTMSKIWHVYLALGSWLFKVVAPSERSKSYTTLDRGLKHRSCSTWLKKGKEDSPPSLSSSDDESQYCRLHYHQPTAPKPRGSTVTSPMRTLAKIAPVIGSADAIVEWNMRRLHNGMIRSGPLAHSCILHAIDYNGEVSIAFQYIDRLVLECSTYLGREQ